MIYYLRIIILSCILVTGTAMCA